MLRLTPEQKALATLKELVAELRAENMRLRDQADKLKLENSKLKRANDADVDMHDAIMKELSDPWGNS
jgi:hypothetical protein